IGTSEDCASIGSTGCKLLVFGSTSGFAARLVLFNNDGTNGVGLSSTGAVAGVLGSATNGPGVSGSSGLTTTADPGVGVEGAGNVAGVLGRVTGVGSTAVLAQSLDDGAGQADLFVGQVFAGTAFDNRARIDN